MTQQTQQPTTPHLPAHPPDMTEQSYGAPLQTESMNEKPRVYRDYENDAGCHAAQSDEAMPRPRKKTAIPYRPRSQTRSMNENELHYHQSVFQTTVGLIALALILGAVIAVFYFFGPVAGTAALGVAVPVSGNFFNALPQIGRKGDKQ